MNIQQFGKTEKLEVDHGIVVNHELGAITIFDNQNMNDDTIVDVSILTKDVL